jgi:O-antigen/teichoic acid export membrane protein
MQRKFITNLALILLLNLLIKPFWILGIDRAVQNAVLPEEYGLYYALLNFSFLLNIFLDLGITNFNNKNIAQNNHLLSKHVPGIIMLRFVLGLLYLLLSVGIATVIGYRGYQLGLVALLGMNQFFASFILYLRSNLAGLHLFRTDAIISVLDRLIMILFCSILLWGGITGSHNPFKIEWFIFSQSAAYIITILISLVVVIDKAKLKTLNWNTAFFMVILKKSFPYAILILLMTFYNRLDAVMIERLLSDGEFHAAIYASAYRLLDASNMIAYLFAGLLLPIFSKMLKQRDSIMELSRLAFSLLMVIAVTAACICTFLGKELVAILYHHHVDESAQVLSVLMWCFTGVSTTYVFGTLLTANGNLRVLNIMAATGIIINIILNLILIPRYKALGAAYSSLFTQMSTALFQVMFSAWLFRFKINYRYLIALLAFVMTVILASHFISANFTLNLLIKMMVITIFSVVMAVALRIINIPVLLQSIRNEKI